MIFMPHWPVMFGQEVMESGTERVLKLLSRIGNPQDNLPPVIHVAGTNGKGSTIAFMKAVLMQAGYRVHAYTAPHLLRFNERIILAGEEVEDGELHAAIEECRIAAGNDCSVTFFEGTTAAAFLLFSRIPADVVLIETGMGGRLDATNVIKKPAVTVIVPISLDHQAYLGPDVKVIAGEKAEIARENVPFVVAPQLQDAMEVLSVLAYKSGAPLFRYGYEWNVAAENPERELLQQHPLHFRFVSEAREVLFPIPNLVGFHQITNAATAIAALIQLNGFAIPDEAFWYGLTNADWPARLQKIEHSLAKALPPEWELWLDGAHNEGGAKIIRQWAENLPGDKPLYVIFGTTKGKDAQAFFRQLSGQVVTLYGVKVMSEPDSYSAMEIMSMAEGEGIAAIAVESLNDAVTAIINTHKGKPARVLVCGSLFLAGDLEKAGKKWLVN